MSGGSSEGEGREARFRRLTEIGTAILSELDLESVLVSVVDAARELTGARYAALGVLDRDRSELERFIHRGIDAETEREIGDLPRGRGVLGELIREPATLRLRDVNEHPHAYGFPPGHPPMRSFLGVPIKVRGEVFGNLYMTEKRDAAEFGEVDAEAAETLAIWAGIAIENARLYTDLAAREAELQIALRQAETSVDIARTVGGETDVERVLDLIVKRARALVDARVLVVLLRRGERLFVAARAGQIGDELDELSLPVGDPACGATMRERLGATSALVVPLVFRGHTVGDLVAFDREAGGTDFDREDERLLQAFAASAATAVATAQMVESERLRQQVEVAEHERNRWAQELHDDTLQDLAAIRISLAVALQGDAEDRVARLEQAAEETIERLESQIGELNRLIDDLRPASLERLGLAAALEALADECAARGEFEVEARVELADELGRDEERTVYRLAQEALNNVARHADASRVTLEAERSADGIRLAIVDDGDGFDPAGVEGRGLAGMRERAESLGGQVEVDSRPTGGTRVVARLPVRGPGSPGVG